MDFLTPEGAAAALTATKTTLDIATGALTLLQQVRSEGTNAATIDEHLLRLALLAVDRNLVVLDGVNTYTRRDESGPLLEVAAALDIKPLGALLLNWPVPGDEPTPPRGFNRKRDFDDWQASLDERQRHEALLANARFVVARVSGLQALAWIHEDARKNIKVGLRLRNIRDAHIVLKRHLCDQKTLSHLVQPRASHRTRDESEFPNTKETRDDRS